MIEYGFTWFVGQAVSLGSDHATVPDNQRRGAEQSRQSSFQHSVPGFDGIVRASFAGSVASVVLAGAVLGLGYALNGSCLGAKRPPAIEL